MVEDVNAAAPIVNASYPPVYFYIGDGSGPAPPATSASADVEEDSEFPEKIRSASPDAEKSNECQDKLPTASVTGVEATCNSVHMADGRGGDESDMSQPMEHVRDCGNIPHTCPQQDQELNASSSDPSCQESRSARTGNSGAAKLASAKVDDVELDDEERAVLAEVSRKGYYHGRLCPASVPHRLSETPSACQATPSTSAQEQPQPLSQPQIQLQAVHDEGNAERTEGNGASSRTHFDEFQSKWDKFGREEYIADLEKAAGQACHATARGEQTASDVCHAPQRENGAERVSQAPPCREKCANDVGAAHSRREQAKSASSAQKPSILATCSDDPVSALSNFARLLAGCVPRSCGGPP